MSPISVFEEDPDLSNKIYFFDAMYVFDSLIIGFLFLVWDASFLSVFKLPITSLTVSSVVGTNGLLEDMIPCLDIFEFF